MGAVVGFPADRAANPCLARMRCEECGGAPMVFVPVGVVIHAYCGPICAAGCGVAPWAGADLVSRAGWRDRAEMEASA